MGRRSRRPRLERHALAAALAAAAIALSGLVSSGASTTAAYAAPVVATRAAPACTNALLTVTKGRLEGAAGSRFQTVRVTNSSAHACSTPGWTRYHFLNRTGLIGFRSARNPGFDPSKAPVVIRAGRTVRSVLSWVDPGPVPAGQCHARHATGFRVRLAGIPGFHRLPLDATVCTTKKFRPHGTRLSH